MQASVNADSDGIEIAARPPIKKGFVQVDTSGTEYDLSDTPSSKYARVHRIHAICTDPTGSVGGVWEILQSAAGTKIFELAQPMPAANLVIGRELVFEFPTPLSSAQSGDLTIKPTANLGKWKIAAMGYFTNVKQIP